MCLKGQPSAEMSLRNQQDIKERIINYSPVHLSCKSGMGSDRNRLEIQIQVENGHDHNSDRKVHMD